MSLSKNKLLSRDFAEGVLSVYEATFLPKTPLPPPPLTHCLFTVFSQGMGKVTPRKQKQKSVDGWSNKLAGMQGGYVGRKLNVKIAKSRQSGRLADMQKLRETDTSADGL
jgi:hypothetical protein